MNNGEPEDLAIPRVVIEKSGVKFQVSVKIGLLNIT